MTRTVWHWAMTICLGCNNTIAVRGNPLSHGSNRFDASAPVYRRCSECAAGLWFIERTDLKVVQ